MAGNVKGDWQKELDRVCAEDPGFTAIELAESAGLSLRIMQRIIRDGLKQGRYIRGWAYRQDAIGRRQRVPVYRVAKAEAKR